MDGRQRQDPNYWWNEAGAVALCEVAGRLVRCSAACGAPPLGAFLSHLSGSLVTPSASVLNIALLNEQLFMLLRYGLTWVLYCALIASLTQFAGSCSFQESIQTKILTVRIQQRKLYQTI